MFKWMSKSIFKVLKKSCGLYYKYVTIVNYDSSIIIKWSFKLIDDASVVIYNRNMFMIQTTDCLQ